MRRKVGKLERPALQVGEKVKLTVAISVRGKHIFDLKPPAFRIALGLLHSFERVFAFFFGFQYRHRQRLGHITHLNTKKIIGAARPGAPPSFCSGRFHRRRRFEL